MTLAFLYVGQGARAPWVEADLLDRPASRGLLALASEVAGADVDRLVRRGGRELERTEILQPALVAVCLAATRALEEAGLRAGFVCGHSLGELTAWAAAGCISPEEAIRVAALRGRLMAREAARVPGSMAALRDVDADGVAAALALGRSAGWVTVAAYNAPLEVTLSGSAPALTAIRTRFHTFPLPALGPWHCPAMAGAVDELRSCLGALVPRQARARFVCNRDGTIAAEADIPELLVGQLVRPVQWVAALRTLAASGVSRFVAVGPGKLMRALVRLNLGTAAEVVAIEGERDLARAAEAA